MLRLMTVKSQEYSGTLDVTRAALGEEIKPAFRQFARLGHPDMAKNKIVAEAKLTL